MYALASIKAWPLNVRDESVVLKNEPNPPVLPESSEKESVPSENEENPVSSSNIDSSNVSASSNSFKESELSAAMAAKITIPKKTDAINMNFNFVFI